MHLVMLLLTSLMMLSHTVMSVSPDIALDESLEKIQGASDSVEEKLEHIREFMKNVVPDQHEHHRGKRFINAQEYRREQVPKFLVRIERMNMTGDNLYGESYTTICSGSIIAENMVLTSAGCLYDVNTKWKKPHNPIPQWQLQVVGGGYDRTETGNMEQIRRPVMIYYHPEAQLTDFRYMWKADIAIIHLDQKFRMTEKVGLVNLWLSKVHTNASYVNTYNLVKASGWGDAGSTTKVQYGDVFQTNYKNTKLNKPTFQYYAMMPEADQSCISKQNDEAYYNGIAYDMYLLTLRPKDTIRRIEPLFSAKRCFYTGSEKIAHYQTTDGDWGGPITFENVDNFKEYQIYMIPWQKPEKSSFETGVNFQVWGEQLEFHRIFIGRVFNMVNKYNAKFYRPDTLSASLDPGTYTKTVDFAYFHHYTFNVDIDFPIFKPEINMTLTDTNCVGVMMTAQVNIRDRNTNEVLRQYGGKTQAKITKADVVDSFTGKKGDRWGCDNLEAKKIVKPEKDAELNYNELYTCSDTSDGKPGKEPVPGHIDFSTPWEEIKYVGELNVTNIRIEVLLHSPLKSRDHGEVVFTLNYKVQGSNTLELTRSQEKDCIEGKTALEKCTGTVERSSEPVCDNDYRLCDDRLSCILNEYKCDGTPDCTDGNDESFWCLDKKCKMSEFQCLTGECLRLHYLCDGRCDCQDKVLCEDETHFCFDNPLNEKYLKDPAKYEEDKRREAGVNQTKKTSSAKAPVYELLFTSLFLLFSVLI